jgi:ArsR family transcriptional regulator
MPEIASLQLFKILSDETRLGIVLLLREGWGSCAYAISAQRWNNHNPRPPAIWRCFGESGLLLDRKQGKWVHYQLIPAYSFLGCPGD